MSTDSYERMTKDCAALDEAYEHFKAAERELAKAVQQAYPVGTHMNVVIGRAYISVEVLGHSQWDVREMTVQNRATGKMRRIMAVPRSSNEITHVHRLKDK